MPTLSESRRLFPTLVPRTLELFFTLLFASQSTCAEADDVLGRIRAVEQAGFRLESAQTVKDRMLCKTGFDEAVEAMFESRVLMDNTFGRMVEEAESSHDLKSLFFAFRALDLNPDNHAQSIVDLVRISHDDPGLLICVSNCLARRATPIARSAILNSLFKDPATDWVGVKVVGHSGQDMREFSTLLSRVWEQDGQHTAWISKYGSLSIFDRQNVADAVTQSRYMPTALQDELLSEAGRVDRPPLLTIACQLALATAGTAAEKEMAESSLLKMCDYAFENEDGSLSSAFRYLAESPAHARKRFEQIEAAAKSENLTVRRNALNVLVKLNDPKLVRRLLDSAVETRNLVSLKRMLEHIASVNQELIPLQWMFENWNSVDAENRKLAFQLLLRTCHPGNTELIKRCCRYVDSSTGDLQDEALLLLDLLAKGGVAQLTPKQNAVLKELRRTY